jgi:hypothetical protein
LGINKKAKDNKNEETELITSVLIEGNKFQKF